MAMCRHGSTRQVWTSPARPTAPWRRSAPCSLRPASGASRKRTSPTPAPTSSGTRAGPWHAFSTAPSSSVSARSWTGTRPNPRRDIARFLDTDELARLGRALDAREEEWPEAVAAIRLLALTGCRRGKVLNLRWRDIGENVIALPDAKTGPRNVPLGGAARAVINTLPEPRDPDAYLFPRLAGGRHAHRLVACWQTVCDDANLDKFRLHDLRHTAASHAVMSGENLQLLGKLLGHRRHETTAGYAHLADGHLVETAEKIGSLIAEAMNLRSAPHASGHCARRTYNCWI